MSKIKRVTAKPEKEFFVHMLTKDISVLDCILDLVDNAVDAAQNGLPNDTATEPSAMLTSRKLEGSVIALSVEANRFEISDNCGGMPVSAAVDYAFRFGRPRTIVSEPYGIGLYGIGMKRAIFKLGSKATIRSNHTGSGFEMKIDVDRWLGGTESDWDFELTTAVADPSRPAGLTIEVDQLNTDVATEMNRLTFLSELRAALARDYALILRRGIVIKLNGESVAPQALDLLDDASGMLLPAKRVVEFTGGTAELIVGLRAASAGGGETGNEGKKLAEGSGWYVACNDRMVLTADKTSRSVWGVREFPVWHSQYNGFFGLARFFSRDPAVLPWTTTKRGLDTISESYTSVLPAMQELTRYFVAWTNKRKPDEQPDVDEVILRAASRDVELVASRQAPLFPHTSAASPKWIRVCYDVERDKVALAKRALRGARLTAASVGRKTFDYFYDREVGENE